MSADNLYEKPLVNLTEDDDYASQQNRDLSESVYVRVLFGVLYAIIFLLGISGNMMVLMTVLCNKHMHTVTNVLITNLAMSDIFTDCVTVPLTPAISTLICATLNLICVRSHRYVKCTVAALKL